MFRKLTALPLPKPSETVARGPLTPAILIEKRKKLFVELGQVEAMISESICGAADESQDVEKYDGGLGVKRTFVDEYEPTVGQLQWLDLNGRFTGAGESPGTVTNARWGSGCMISNDLFITAGHCFDQEGGGWERPSRSTDGRKEVILPAEIATLMQVNFNYQVNGATNQTRPGESFPVTALVEYREGINKLDYAIVRLGPNADGILPGAKYGRIVVAGQDLLEPNAMLCVIQHPNGAPKRIEAGEMLGNSNGQISYDSIDTLGGSSGAPVLSPAGELVGVHTTGGCSAIAGSNSGTAIGAIRAVATNLPGGTEVLSAAPQSGGTLSTITGAEYVKRLNQEVSAASISAILILTGMVKPSSNGSTDSLMFAPGGSCDYWVSVPVAMIAQVEVLRKVPCKNHQHDLARLHLRSSNATESQLLVDMLDRKGTVETGVAETPSALSRARCMDASRELASVILKEAARSQLSEASAIYSIRQKFGVSESVASFAITGAKIDELAAVMCGHLS